MSQPPHHGRTSPPPSSAPDTEAGMPPSSSAPASQLNEGSRTRARQAATERGPLPSGSTKTQVQSFPRVNPPPEQDSGSGGHTTLQSMKRPEPSPSSSAHARRFLSIENQLADLEVALRVNEKRLQRAEKRLLGALTAAGVALLLACLGMVI